MVRVVPWAVFKRDHWGDGLPHIRVEITKNSRPGWCMATIDFWELAPEGDESWCSNIALNESATFEPVLQRAIEEATRRNAAFVVLNDKR